MAASHAGTGLPQADISGVTVVNVEAISLRLFRNFYAQRIDVQDFVALMRRFSHENDSQLRRIHQTVIALLMGIFQSLPHWPEKELLRTAELLGQLIRWDLIPDGGPLQRALCCMLHAFREPANSLLYRFGHRLLEQFRGRLAESEVGLALTRHIVQPSLRHEEEERREDRRPSALPQAAQAAGLRWHLPSNGLQLLRTQVPLQVSGTPLASVPSTAPRAQGTQASGVTWMFGGVAKAAPRQAKQGAMASSEEKRDRGKQNKRSSAKKKNAANQDQRTSWPAFIEVELDTMKFCLTDEDVQVCNREADSVHDAPNSDEHGAS
ncbi:cnot1 [Symbiodinium pilosum]|uniref:Cnot1 protein n=1 Tax=Symbiodinium pilosum TaxID=2952 RepID=A0A812MHY4_SYMPI|nr:cnot1 [Symbiodinium pilosum]